VQVIESFRQDGKVKQKIIASLGVVKSDEDKQRLIDMAQALINKMSADQFNFSESQKNIDSINESTNCKPVNPKNLVHVRDRISGFQEVYGALMKQVGFTNELLNIDKNHKHVFELSKIIPMLIEKRLQCPASKRRSLFIETLEQGALPIQLHQIYRAMDILLPYKDHLQNAAWNAATTLFDQPIECLFYDATTLYFESIKQDETRNFGFSKDGKFNQVQIVFCLMVTTNGVPVGYEVFPGNTAETKTLRVAIEELSKRMKIQNVTIVCDRGMLAGDNLEYANNEIKMKYIVGEKLRKLPAKHQEIIFDISKYEQINESLWLQDIEHPTRDKKQGARLILAYSPERAKKDKTDRERLLAKLEKKVAKKNTGPKDFISNSGVKKYVSVSGGVAALNKEAILKDEKWDGFFGIVTNHSKETLNAKEILSHYRGLWQVEAAFRVSKHDLSTRPIFHWTPDRIHSHVLICFLSLVLERHLEVLLKQRNTPVTTTQIHDALGKCKKIIFQDNKSNRLFEMDSNKPIEAKKIYEAVGLRWRYATRELENPGGNVVPSSVSVMPQLSGIDPL
jgi:transposase